MKLGTAAPAALSSETERLCWTAGIVIGAIVLAVTAYPLALAFIKSRKHLQEIIHHKPQS